MNHKTVCFPVVHLILGVYQDQVTQRVVTKSQICGFVGSGETLLFQCHLFARTHQPGSRVEMSDLTWEEKEQVLRLLFAKMNGQRQR